MENLKKLRENRITFKCEICDKEFKTKNGLRKHFNIIHNTLEKEYPEHRRLTGPWVPGPGSRIMPKHLTGP